MLFGGLLFCDNLKDNGENKILLKLGSKDAVLEVITTFSLQCINTKNYRGFD